MSRGDVQRIEADYRRHALGPVPRWAYGATLLVSGALAISPVFVPSTSREDKVVGLGLGGAHVIIGATSLTLALATDSQYEHYEKQLKKVRLTPVGPGGAAGLWASATF
jgi:hypothetical protein